jgi:hypothetical protein
MKICVSTCFSLYLYLCPTPFYEDTSHMGLGFTIMTSFNLNYLFKDPVSKYSHILGVSELGLQHKNLERTILYHNTVPSIK